MKRIMQRTLNAAMLGLALLATQTAFAYYNPATGRFLSRDPVGEPGFQTLQMAQRSPQFRQIPAAQQTSRWINRDAQEGANSYHFVANSPLNSIDALGLLRFDSKCKPSDIERMKNDLKARCKKAKDGNCFSRLLKSG